MKIKPLLHYTLFMFVLMVMPVHQVWAACADKKLVVVGDSLVAGYGLPPGAAFPEQLAVSLKQSGYDIAVINAGVSGDTTSGGLSRLDWSLGDGADLVILELGANDALRGIPVDVTRKNLDAMIAKLTARGTRVLLAGMMAPPNMGARYGEAFNAIIHLVGAIVTDHGSFASHAGIVAREMGFPAVVGTTNATSRIPAGAIVRVDGDAGEVTVLS